LLVTQSSYFHSHSLDGALAGDADIARLRHSLSADLTLQQVFDALYNIVYITIFSLTENVSALQ
jgi:hypothetical protein